MLAVASEPLVSVVMAVYNGAEFIGEAIASVLAQTYERQELIIVDDGSRDDTVALVEHWMTRDKRVRLHRRPHLGHAQALNAGIEAADGAFIARIDHDDLWHPQHLAIQSAWMERHGVDVCGSWVRRFGAKSGVIRFAQSHEAIRYETLFTCPILDSATLFRGDVLRANPYPPEAIVRQELTQLVRLLPHYRFANIPRYLCDYRAHSQQKTARFGAMVQYRHAQLCAQHFINMFPGASAQDIATFATITAAVPEPLDRAQLLVAGELFARYMQPQDGDARLRMRRRWRHLCRDRSKQGLTTDDIYNDTLAKLR